MEFHSNPEQALTINMSSKYNLNLNFYDLSMKVLSCGSNREVDHTATLTSRMFHLLIDCSACGCWLMHVVRC